MNDNATISNSKLRKLVKDSLMLEELRAWGVDNWQGYDYVVRPTDEDIDNRMRELTDEATS